MLRNALVAVSLLLFGGFVVALVNAQDFVRRSTEPTQPGARLANRLQALRDDSAQADNRGDAVAGSSLREPGTFPLANDGNSARPLGTSPQSGQAVGNGVLRPTAGGTPLDSAPSNGLHSVLKRPDREEAAAVGGFEPVDDQVPSSRRAPSLNNQYANPETFAEPSNAPQLTAPGSPALFDPQGSQPQTPDGAQTLDGPRALNGPQPVNETPSFNESQSGPPPRDTTSSDLAPQRIAARPAPPQRVAAPATALFSSESPSIRVETQGPASITIGKQATYIVHVTNQGNQPASGIEVLVGVPRSVVLAGSEAGSGRVDAEPGQAAGQLAWTIDQLAPRSTAKLQIKLLPQSPRPFTLGIEWTLRPQVAQTQVLVQEPKLDLSISGAKDVLFGETKIYTLVLSNPGTGDAENVAVTLGETANSGATKQLGTLAAGERRELDIELTAREAGTMQIQALAVADGDLRSEAALSVRVRRARLEVQVSGPPRRFAGASASYEVRIKNMGDAIAEDVIAAVVIPEGAKYLGGIASASAEARRIQWAVGMLNPGSEKQFQLHFDLTLPGDNRIDTRVLAAGDLSATAAAVTRVEALADLKLLVNDPRGPKSVGEEVVYEVLVMNRGTKSARNIEILAQFSAGIEPVRADGAAADVVPGQVLFKPIAEIAPGDRVMLKITARASKEGNHIFRAEVKCGDPETRLVTEETTRFFGAGILGP
jgi:uncharacterized repeat protein (TIGR01451 family)